MRLQRVELIFLDGRTYSDMKFLSIIVCVLLIVPSAFCQITGDGTVLENFRAYVWDNLPDPDGFINDYEKIFSDEEILRLNNLIKNIEKETSVEIGVVTIDTLMVADDLFLEFTLHLARTWGVGKAGLDNGIVIGLSKGYRMIRINNGIGISRLISDAETKQVLDNCMLPHFRDGDYFSGIRDGIIEMVKLYEERR